MKQEGKFEISKISEAAVNKFSKKYPAQYDLMFEILDTVKAEDIDLAGQVMILEVLRHHAYLE